MTTFSHARTVPVRYRAPFGLLATALVATLVLAGCASSTSGEGETAQDSPSSSPVTTESTAPAGSRGALTFGVVAVPPSLNPGIGDPAYNPLYQWAYDPLVVLRPDGTFGPGLATRWGYVDDANQRYELTLREGVKFSDGTDLDAEAVKTFLDYVREQPTSAAQLLANVEAIEVTGPLSLAISLSAPDPGLTFAFAQAFGAGNIASPDAVAEPESLDFATAGAGPYMLDPDESVAQDHYTFVPNPHYWDPSRVHWDEVVVRYVPNSSSMIEAMRAGQIQAAQGDATTLQAAAEAGLTVVAAPQAMTGLNLMDRDGQLLEALGDVRVRQALNHAVDRAAIAEALYGDAQLALAQYALDGNPGYDPALDEANAYDLALARELLAEAGYADGFTLPVVDINLIGLHTLMEALDGQLSQIGVTLDITTASDLNEYVTSMTSREMPAAALGYGLATMQSLYVGYINPAGPFNPFQTVDPELDELYAEYYATVGDSSDAQRRINARLVEQAWALPTVAAPLAWYLAEGLTGIEATTGNSAVPTFPDIRPAS